MVGHEWMENWVHIMRDNFGRLTQDIPPLASRWLKAQDELAAAHLTGKTPLSPPTLFTVQLGKDMKILANTPGFTNQLALLKNHTSFHRGCFRLAVAAAHVRRGDKLTFLIDQHSHWDLVLQPDHGPIPVITKPITAHNLNQLLTSLISELRHTTLGVTNGGIIYLELPLPPEHIPPLLAKIKDACNSIDISSQVTVVLATATIMKHHPWEVKYTYWPLGNAQYYPVLQ